jgi:hypothetical protein
LATPTTSAPIYKEALFHNAKECGLVLEDRFKAVIGDQDFILEAGDSIYFDSTISHRWEVRDVDSC